MGHTSADVRGKIAAGWLTLLLLLAGFIALQVAARADEWMPAEIKTYYSQDGSARFTVTPRGVRSPLAYFQGKARNEDHAGQDSGGSPYARGVLERKDRAGRWVVVWDKQLVNDVSPVSALVANSARYVVTFDNWHMMGWGNDVVVIYGAGGKQVRSLALTDLLPDYYVKALPRSVSSIWWSGKHRIADRDGLLILSVVVPDDEADLFSDKRKYVELPVRLANGDVLPVAGADWDRARLVAQKVAADRQKSEDERNVWFRSPLVAPKTAEWTDWLPYLHEIFARSDPDWHAEESDSGKGPDEIILPSATAKGFGGDPADLRRAFLEWPEPHVIAIGSPGGDDALVKALTPILAEAKPDSLKGSRIYVVCTPEYRERLVALLAATGATVIPVDPAIGIPQRPERLKEEGLAP